MRWRAVTLALGLSAALAASAAAAGPSPIQPINGPPPLKVITGLSSHQPGAQPVVMNLAFTTALVCGYPMGTTQVTLPDAVSVPQQIAPAAVSVNLRAASKVTVSGHTITISAPVHHGVMCHSVVDATMHVVLTRAVGLGNPAQSGTYPVIVHRGKLELRGTFTIS
jgi:hypothetical protein